MKFSHRNYIKRFLCLTCGHLNIVSETGVYILIVTDDSLFRISKLNKNKSKIASWIFSDLKDT